MSEKKIDVILGLIDNFSTGFSATMAMMGTATATAERAWKNVIRTGDGIAQTGRNLTAAVTLPLVGLGVAGVKSYGEVDKTLRLVSETMGSTSDEAKALEESMKTAATNSVFSMQESADATLNFARQGFNAEQAASMLTPALNLAAGTASDLSLVTGGLGNTLKAFGADASDAAHYSDMMAKAQAQANTDVTGLFEAMSIAGPTAKTVGWSFSDLAVLTGTFGDKSISASEGATALNTGLMRLAKPTAEASDWMEALGIEVFNADGSLKSMPDTIGELQKGFAGLTEQEQLAAAASIFGKNQASKWVALINGEGTEALQSLKENIEGATGASERMAEALLSGPGGALERLSSTFDVFKYTIGGVMGEAVGGFVEKIIDLMTAFNEADPAIQASIVRWGLIAAAVGPAIILFGTLISSIGKIGLAFTALSRLAHGAGVAMTAITAAGGPLPALLAAIATPAGVVIAVIAVIGVVVAAVVTHFDTFKTALGTTSPHMQKLQAAFGRLQAAAGPFMSALGQVAKFLWDVFGNTIAAVAGFIVSVLGGALSGVIDVVTGIMQTITGIVDFVAGVFTGDWERAWDGIVGIFNGVKNTIGGIVNGIKNFFNGLLASVANVAKAIGSAFAGSGIASGGDHGKSLSGYTPPGRAIGDISWAGGMVHVHEQGGEIIDLPRGSRIYPHDESIQMAKAAGGTTVTIPKLADQIIVREAADIDRIGTAIARKLLAAGANMGGV